MTRLSPQLRDRAFRWIADDPDAGTKAELQRVVAEAMGGAPGAVDELADRMNGTLTFGTAGLRGRVRAGSAGMNTAVVVRATAGVAEWLRHKGNDGGTVFVGRDARHGSAEFATAAAEVLAAAGFSVRLLPGPLPTPLTAFLVRTEHAVAGVQVTASHNPPADNGYKVYVGAGPDAGAQIAPPDDGLIETAIRSAPAARMVPTASGALPVSQAQLDGYLERVATLPRGGARALRVALTPMHGVGGATVTEALRRAGFTDVRLVGAQAEPDPDFPTVAFPNPEEPGAADLLLDLAAESDADLAIALDPDADRCGLGVRERDGSWRMLSGDETGALLGAHVLSTLDESRQPDPLVASTIVSSQLLGAIASAHGVRHEETLTGFKWLMRAGDGHGTGLVYAYEEALGVCVDPEFVRDKDGVSAAVLACDLAATRRAAGQTLLDALDELSVAHGVHLTEQVSLRSEDTGALRALMTRLRDAPPAELAGVPVRTTDLLDQLPRADVLRLSGDGVRVVVRPSGTEPKLKAYLQVVEPVPATKTTGTTGTTDTVDTAGTAGAELVSAKARAADRLAALRTEVTALLSG